MHRRQEAAWKDLHAWIEEWSGGTRTNRGYGAFGGYVAGQEQSGQIATSTGSAKSCKGLLSVARCMAFDGYAFDRGRSQRSFRIALALLCNAKATGSSSWSMDVTNAMAAARAEEEFNISNWGFVEGGHDYDRLNCSVQLHAAVVLKDCLAMDAIDN